MTCGTEVAREAHLLPPLRSVVHLSQAQAQLPLLSMPMFRPPPAAAAAAFNPRPLARAILSRTGANAEALIMLAQPSVSRLAPAWSRTLGTINVLLRPEGSAGSVAVS